MKRRALTLFTLLAVAFAAMFVPQAAYAIVADGDVGESSGNATGRQVWDAGPESYLVRITPGSGSSLPTNYCFDSFLDWGTVNGHWDIRIARTCDTGFLVTQSGDDTDAHRQLTGANRLATCKGVINQTASGSCSNHSYAVYAISGAADNLAADYYCARGRAVWKGGSGPHYFTGGVSWDCNS